MRNEKLMKILAVYNKEKYCLCVYAKGQERVYDLYLMRENVEDFISDYNTPILSSDYGDTVNDLISYLKNHNGFVKEWWHENNIFNRANTKCDILWST